MVNNLLCKLITNKTIFCYHFQRRSLAPSQISSTQLKSTVSTSSDNVLKAFKAPISESVRKKRKCVDVRKENKALVPKLSSSDYEELIAKLLHKPFKVPIPDYVPDTHGSRCLGLKRNVIRRALHDPFACNALVLYSPPEIPEIEQMKMEKNQIMVHVVVDPVVGNILRPHQRDGVKFMYDCVTGAKGDFNGCIMADEVSYFIIIK